MTGAFTATPRLRPRRLRMAVVLGAALFGAPAVLAEHRFFEPTVFGLPIDRCKQSGADRCSVQSRQQIADFFCSTHGYTLGAEQISTRFVGPLPQRVAQLQDLVPPPKFVVFNQGLDIINFMVCRMPAGSPRLQTSRVPNRNGDRIDRCINNHPDFNLVSRCSQAAQRIVADAYCRRGLDGAQAVSWGVEEHIGIHAVFDAATGGFGNIPGTDALKELTCRQEAQPRLLRPIAPITTPPIQPRLP